MAGKKAHMTLNPGQSRGKINREIYGHFSEHLGRCIYEGLYVGENSDIPNKNGVRTDVIDALKQLRIPVLRWPGGCFADEYHWKDGIGPKETRKKMVNTNWGGVTEDNSFGTHEFMNLCEELGCEPYVNGNVGSGTVQEMAEWIEYMTFDGVSPMADLRRANGRENPWKLKYFGVGNEAWGCGGNMEPEYYSDLYRQYQTFCKNYSGNELYKIAVGPGTEDPHWTDVLMKKLKFWDGTFFTNGISLHYYTLPTGDWSHKGDAVEFDRKEYYATIVRTCFMEPLLKIHTDVMDKYDPDKKVGLIVDEWGCWYDVEKGTNPGFLYQQNTMRDAIVAAINLNIFNQHCDRVKMANIAQMVNVLQAVILTEGAKMIKTPTYHVFDMFKGHQDAELLRSELETVDCDSEDLPEGKELNILSHSASADKDGNILITFSNASLDDDVEITCDIAGNVGGCSAKILTGAMDARNTFDAPEALSIGEYDGAVLDAANCQLKVTVPACSVVSVSLKK